MNDNKHPIFVYGTLLSGEQRNHVLSDADFLGEAITYPEFTLVSLGPYPALILGGKTEIKGELYLVDSETLERLDKIEGYVLGRVSNLYERVSIYVQTRLSGDCCESEYKAETYVMSRFQMERKSHVEEITSGSWKEHQGAKKCASTC